MSVLLILFCGFNKIKISVGSFALTGIISIIHVEIQSTLIVKKMQVKTTMRNHYTFTRMAKIKEITILSVDKHLNNQNIHCWWECKIVWTVSYKVTHANTHLPFNSDISLLVGIYAREMKIYIFTWTCMRIFIEIIIFKNSAKFIMLNIHVQLNKQIVVYSYN